MLKVTRIANKIEKIRKELNTHCHSSILDLINELIELELELEKECNK